MLKHPRGRLSIGARFGLIVTLGTAAILAVSSGLIYQRLRSQDELRTRQVASATAEHLQAAVRIVFESAFNVLDTTIDCLTTFKDDGITDPRVYDTMLKRMIDADRYGAWLVWDAADAPRDDGPRSDQRNKADLSMYWHQNGIEIQRDTVPPEILASDLYQVPRRSSQAYLLEPHVIEARAGDPTAVTSFAKPLEHDGKTVGVLAIDVRFDAIGDALRAISLPPGASINIVSDRGTLAMSTAGGEFGRMLSAASPDLAHAFEAAKQGNGSEVRADGTTSVLVSWSKIRFAGVQNPWYLIMRMPERSLGAATSEDRAFLYTMVSLAMLATLALVFFTMRRLVAVPLQKLSAIINGLGEGLFDFTVPGSERTDEVGDIARAVERLQDGSIKIARLQEENSESAYQRLVARRTEMDGISTQFSSSIEAMVTALNDVASTVESRSCEVSTRASDAVSNLGLVSQASNVAKDSMASVAAATSSLLATIGSIGDRTRKGEAVSAKVEAHAASTNRSILDLKTTIGSIEKVAALIRGVASQINLIALNATIEAARAGEAGLGFAVVAQEIKGLAMQTAKATEEISRQISAVQKASSVTDANVAEMSKSFGEMREISVEIAAALEIQLSATDAISSVVDKALGGTDDMATHVSGLVKSSEHVQSAADVMRAQSGSLSVELTGLRREVSKFLDVLRAA